MLKLLKTMRKSLSRILMLAVIAVSMTCCNSPESKIESMVEELVKNYLYVPDSYDPIDIRIDSAFTPYDDPEFRQFIVKASKKLEEKNRDLEYCEMEIESDESSMELWEDDWYSRRYYNNAKEDYAEHTAEKEEIVNEINDIKSEIKERMSVSPKFIGYKALHSYRAESNAGYTSIGTVVCIFDKDVTGIVAAYDTEDADYVAFTDFLEKINDGEIDLGI